MNKNEIIKNEVKILVENYLKDSNCNNFNKLIKGIKDSFLNNCNFAELTKVYQFIRLPDLNLIIYYYENQLAYDYCPIIINIDKKYKKLIGDKIFKKQITESILNGLVSQGQQITPDIWSLIKFKDKIVLLKCENPKDAPLNININKNCDTLITFSEIDQKFIWDFSA